MIRIDRRYWADCALGRLTCGGLHCFTLELPDKHNAPNISCIPPGIYLAFKRYSPKNGHCIQLRNVPGRTYIQIHAGNYTRQIAGCILPGDSIKMLDGDNIPDVTNSRVTLERILNQLPDEFEVIIADKNHQEVAA